MFSIIASICAAQFHGEILKPVQREKSVVITSPQQFSKNTLSKAED